MTRTHQEIKSIEAQPMSKSWDILRNVNEFVRFSDTKAGVVLAFAGGAGVFLANKAGAIHALIVAHGNDGWSWLLYSVFYGYLVALCTTIAFAFTSIVPSLGSSEKRSLLYFKHICEDFQHDHNHYAESLSALDEKAMESELAHQICVNAGIATRKYDWVGRAIVALVITGAFWAVTVFLILLLGEAVTPSK